MNVIEIISPRLHQINFFNQIIINMANTYKKLYLQAVFVVKNRQALLHKPWRMDLCQYIAGIINQRGHYSYAVNGHHDHIHLFFDYKGHELVSDLIREIKKTSNAYINDKCLTSYRFDWQSGYGIFPHGYKEKDVIINYVKNQEYHHKQKSFKKEYFQFLKSYEIEFKNEYAFDFIL
jgi:putative transposase